ncbi:hypothetical protein LSAT2_006454 [Lamellibrachia satsuma]|nr:hypothetical protein LSAT2_006454 [Lamellibrachia satsuma]
MADTGGFPRWLLKSKDQIIKTAEWSSFIHELYDAVEQQLAEGDVQSFSDLTDSERKLFLERASQAIDDGVSHRALQKKVSSLLDRHLNSDVARQLMEDFPVKTKTDLILENAQEGIIGLLKKWPDMKSKLRIGYNQALPPKMRRSVWKLYLKNDKVVKRYSEILANNPRVAISPLDLDISCKCEQLLMSEPTFADLNGSVGAFYAMKAVLSYHHSLKKTRASLPPSDFLLVIPFVYLMAENISRKEPAPGHIVTLFVEEYFTLMNSLPAYVDGASDAHYPELKQFLGTTAKFLFEISPELGRQMANTFIPSDDMIVTTDASVVDLLQDAMLTLARPIIAAMFVSYVSMDVALFIWDQFFITSDVPDFHKELLPAFMAVFFKLLYNKLNDCDSPSSYQAKVKECGRELQVRQFQYEMQKHFFGILQPELTQGDRGALPALDPQALHLPWEHWGGEDIPPFTTSEDRRRVREDRVAEKQRELEEEKEEIERRKREEERERREEEERITQRMKDEKKMTERERKHLEDLLNEEKQKRVKSEQTAALEIEELQREIELLKRYRARSPSLLLKSTQSLYRHLRTNPVPETTRAETPGREHESIIAFVDRVSQSFHRIAHGDGADRALLDQHTRMRQREHAEDVKTAEREVFGRELMKHEFDGMPESDKRTLADRIMQLGEERRQRELDTAGF